MRSVRSISSALRVSGRFGRATKLERDGRADDALRVAREALSLLRAPHVLRRSPAEASLLVSLTVLAERLAVSLRQPGADATDLRESVEWLENLGEVSASVQRMRDEWLPFLRSRLQDAQGT